MFNRKKYILEILDLAESEPSTVLGGSTLLSFMFICMSPRPLLHMRFEFRAQKIVHLQTNLGDSKIPTGSQHNSVLSVFFFYNFNTRQVSNI